MELKTKTEASKTQGVLIQSKLKFLACTHNRLTLKPQKKHGIYLHPDYLTSIGTEHKSHNELYKIRIVRSKKATLTFRRPGIDSRSVPYLLVISQFSTVAVVTMLLLTAFSDDDAGVEYSELAAM